MSHGRSLRAYKKSPSIRSSGVMSIVDGLRYSESQGENFAFGNFDELGGARSSAGTPFDGKFQKMEGIVSRGYRHTGLTPDVGLLGFGSPLTGKSPMPMGTNHYFPTGMTPNDGTPLSEIAFNYTNGSISPSYSPSIFALLGVETWSCPRGTGGGGMGAIGGGLSAIKADNDDAQESMHKSALLTKRKLEGNDIDEAEFDESFQTDSPSESSLDHSSSMSTR